MQVSNHICANSCEYQRLAFLIVEEYIIINQTQSAFSTQ
jgi:hypothetical protein